MRFDLLDYLRVWGVKDDRELFERILAHPEENVRFQVFKMIESYGEEHWHENDVFVEFIVIIWNKRKNY